MKHRDSKTGHFCNTIVTASTSLVKWNFKWAVSKQQHRVFKLAWFTAFLCEQSWDAHPTDVVNHGHPQEFFQKGEPQGQYIKLTTFGNIFYAETAYDVINFKFCERNSPSYPAGAHSSHVWQNYYGRILITVVRCYESIVHIDLFCNRVFRPTGKN